MGLPWELAALLVTPCDKTQSGEGRGRSEEERPELRMSVSDIDVPSSNIRDQPQVEKQDQSVQRIECGGNEKQEERQQHDRSKFVHLPPPLAHCMQRGSRSISSPS